MNKKTISCSVFTLGCKLNFSESSSIEHILRKQGYKIVDNSKLFDVLIINTCSVTNNADKECEYIIRKEIKKNPKVYIVITGCYAQLKPNEITKIDNVNLVIGNSDKFYIGDILEKNIFSDKKIIHNDINIQQFHSANSLYSPNKTRVFLKIQDGCNYKCSFCTIPMARGKSRSNTINNVINDITNCINKGAKEIVLTGVNIGDFGNKQENLLILLQNIENINSNFRIRISSIEPNLLSYSIIEFIKHSKKIVNHLHIPLQSGSTTILKSMRRRYKLELYKNKILFINQEIPKCCIGADIIVGYPGETEECFNESIQFIKNLPISYLHVFTYSDRDNTNSNLLNNKISPFIKKQRNAIMNNLSLQKLRNFYIQNIDEKLDVLFEKINKDGNIYGFTNNYIRVKTKFNDKLINKVKKVILKNIDNDNVCNIKMC
ncbi:MAG: tRNA (N(6)-L-threonylcarbamoyladenosine(37)-C(2))-methylthiotransferase MtaB [Bacteroides sp.]|nr:MAG: tRNA (N(6)-L-threonylcarbamoyladenosine(37)-C(2))-methylthiotransferase MtaB [Bacteroides sp.]